MPHCSGFWWRAETLSAWPLAEQAEEQDLANASAVAFGPQHLQSLQCSGPKCSKLKLRLANPDPHEIYHPCTLNFPDFTLNEGSWGPLEAERT